MRKRTLSKTLTVAGAALALTLGGCASSEKAASDAPAEPTAAAAEEAPAEDPIAEEPAAEEAPAEDPVEDDPVEEEPAEPANEFANLAFGDTLPTTSQDGSASNLTVGKPKKAKCQYSSIGCDKPEIGDRVVEIPLLIENTGDTAVEWGRSYFVLEFADGTQVEMGDGAASDYTPDNALGYDAKVRVGGKLKTSLVFEAPEGPFTLLLLDNTYDGEPFAAWS